MNNEDETEGKAAWGCIVAAIVVVLLVIGLIFVGYYADAHGIDWLRNACVPPRAP